MSGTAQRSLAERAAPPPAAPNAHLPALTTLRGIAAWWVVGFHFRGILPFGPESALQTFLAQGYMAVDLFFQLSGFILFYNYHAAFPTFSLRSVRTFWIARLARIYPLHITILFLMIANPVAILLFSKQANILPRYDLDYFFLSVLLIQNWSFTDHLAWNIPAWSISTEMFCYILFPLLIFPFRRQNTKIRPVLFTYAALYSSIVLIWYNAEVGLGDRIAELGLVRCLAQFMMGVCLCAFYLSRPNRLKENASSVLLFSLAVFLIWMVYEFLPNYIFVPPIWTGVIAGFLGGMAESGPISRNRYLIYLGEISYSTYLIHYFVMDWIKFLFVREGEKSLGLFLIYLLSVLALSILFFHGVEKPGRKKVRAVFG